MRRPTFPTHVGEFVDHSALIHFPKRERRRFERIRSPRILSRRLATRTTTHVVERRHVSWNKHTEPCGLFPPLLPRLGDPGGLRFLLFFLKSPPHRVKIGHHVYRLTDRDPVVSVKAQYQQQPPEQSAIGRTDGRTDRQTDTIEAIYSVVDKPVSQPLYRTPATLTCHWEYMRTERTGRTRPDWFGLAGRAGPRRPPATTARPVPASRTTAIGSHVVAADN
jgi:hypothetical protein